MKRILWALAIAVSFVPALILMKGHTRMARQNARASMAAAMEMEVRVLEVRLGEFLGGLRGSELGPDGLHGIAEAMNRAHLGNVPIQAAPGRWKRTLVLDYDPEGRQLKLTGWGLELDQPIFEKSIPWG